MPMRRQGRGPDRRERSYRQAPSLAGAERVGAAGDLRRGDAGGDGVGGDDVAAGSLVIRNVHCVLRIAHNDVRLTVDQLSGEKSSGNLPLVDYIRQTGEKCPVSQSFSMWSYRIVFSSSKGLR